MRQPPTNICPLLAIANAARCDTHAATCLEERCAWWSCVAGECAITSINDIAADRKEEPNGR